MIGSPGKNVRTVASTDQMISSLHKACTHRDTLTAFGELINFAHAVLMGGVGKTQLRDKGDSWQQRFITDGSTFEDAFHTCTETYWSRDISSA